MTVEISYFKSRATNGLPVASQPGSAAAAGGPNDGAPAESLSITSSPSLSGVTPDGQTAISLIGTEPFRYEYSRFGAVSVTSTSNYVAAGERMWLTPHGRYQFSLRTP
jgi:hypothetical protein